MSAISQGTHRLYFGYQSAARHAPDCPRKGTGLMEVSKSVELDFHGQVREETYRFACGKCGTAFFVYSDHDLSTESTSASQIGFGSKPQKVAGLWLHPGPRLAYFDQNGPWNYLVTRDSQRPASPSDVVGKTGWHCGKRGGVRWSAGTGYDEHGYVTRAADHDFGSRTAAVKWIAAALAGDPR